MTDSNTARNETQAPQAANLPSPPTLDFILTELVTEQRFVRVDSGAGTAAILPVCSNRRCGEVLRDFDMSVWSTLEPHDSAYLGPVIIRAFCKGECDIFAHLRQYGFASFWWQFDQLWQIDQRGPFERMWPGGLPARKRRQARRAA